MFKMKKVIMLGLATALLFITAVGCSNLANTSKSVSQASAYAGGEPPMSSQVIPDKTPQLNVILENGTTEQQVRAMQLTTNWTFTDESGGGGSISFDSLHPLQIDPDDFNGVTILTNGSGGIIELQFSNANKPQTISVTRWNSEYATGSQDINDVLHENSPVEWDWNTITVSDDGHDYIYEVYATWQEGSSYYTFRTESMG